MDKKDMPAFFKFLSVMEEYYQPLSPTLREVYWKGLKAFSLLDIKKALWRYIHSPKNGKFMPKVADFIHYIKGTEEARAMVVWSEVLKAIQEIGAYQSVMFDDPVTTAVIEHMGGWIKLCQTSIKELPFIAKDFEKLYEYYASRFDYFPDCLTSSSSTSSAHFAPSTSSASSASPAFSARADDDKLNHADKQTDNQKSYYLCGIFEHENDLRGFSSPPPIRIPSIMHLQKQPKVLPKEEKEIKKTVSTVKTEKAKKAKKVGKTEKQEIAEVIYER